MQKLQIAAVLLVAVALLAVVTGGASTRLSDSPAVAADAEKVLVPANGPAAEAKKVAPGKVSRTRQVHKQLAQSVTLEEVKANTPLRDVLKTLGDRYKVALVIDKRAFEAIGIAKAGEMPVELPALTDVRLGKVLQLLMKQVKGDVYAGTYQVRPGYVELTTWYHQMVEAAAEAPEHPALHGLAEPIVARELSGDASRKITPVVHVDADQRPLADVLGDLADDAEIDIIIDRRAADKAQVPIDLTLNNVLFDTAVRMLVDAAELDWMWIDNVVYVATKEDIKARRDRKKAVEQEKLKMLREAKQLDAANQPQGLPGLGLGVGGLPVPAPPAAKPIGNPAPPSM